MDPKSKWMMKVTIGAVAAGLAMLSLLPAPAGHVAMTPDTAARALVFGRADAAWTEHASELAAMSPAFANRLSQLARSNQVSPLGRGAALDALVRAGTPEAQSSLRAALAADTVREDSAYPLLLARLGAVKSPTVETIAYLDHVHRAAVQAQASELASASASALSDAVSHRVAMLTAKRHQARTIFARQRDRE
jgi:hypothetical protein